MIERSDVLDALRQVLDPEIGINIVDLGLVYDIECVGWRVSMQMTMTTPACPLGAYLVEEIERAIAEHVPQAVLAPVEIVWEPPWTPDRMTAEARRQLGWD